MDLVRGISINGNRRFPPRILPRRIPIDRELHQKNYPLSNTPREMSRAVANARAMLRRRLTKREYKVIRHIEKEASNPKKWTKEKYSKNKAWRNYKRAILANKFRGAKVYIDNNDPDVYVIGGMAGSGKTSIVKEKYIKEKALYLNADDFKEALAKKEKSPIPKYPMVHSAFLHEDSSEIFDKAMEKARKKKMDVILDVTLGTPAKAEQYAQNFDKKGYDTHLYGVQIYPTQAIRQTTKRFLRNGRYVPAKLIKQKGNTINKTLLDAARKKRWYDSAVIIDNSGAKGKEKVIYSRGRTS